MSVQATSWVWNHSQAEGTARLVLLAIADAANREGQNSCQSVPTIAKMCRLHDATVYRKISELVAIGELAKTGSDRKYGTTIYALPKMSDPSQSATPRNSDMTPSQSATPRNSDMTPSQNATAPLAPLRDNPINPSSSKELHPINNAHTHETVGERQRPAPGRVHYSPAFEQFWEAYPRKEGKLDAYNAWRSASHFNNPSHLIAAAGRYRDNPNRDPRYTKTPTRWLNTRGWEDGPAEPPRPQQPTRVPGWVERSQVTAQAGQQFLNRYYQQHENRPEQGNDWIAGELA
ncbi:helix-turn-helix domain-containing protein [Rothia nasimurium]|uniref:helix-turn-helix domain-containing protein n=1 Tax=Rothia nasimurium TaxID=85336 RepID=UPI001F46FD37|nr:helix-turn-helix domain-containing protein [Rothia nasimurium]